MDGRAAADPVGRRLLLLLRVSHLFPCHPQVRLAEDRARKEPRRASGGLGGPRYGAVGHPPPRSRRGTLVRQAKEVFSVFNQSPHDLEKKPQQQNLLCLNAQRMADGESVPDRAVAAQARNSLHPRGYLRWRQVELTEGNLVLHVLSSQSVCDDNGGIGGDGEEEEEEDSVRIWKPARFSAQPACLAENMANTDIHFKLCCDQVCQQKEW